VCHIRRRRDCFLQSQRNAQSSNPHARHIEDISIYFTGYKGKVVSDLEHCWLDFFSKPAEEQTEFLATAKAAFTAARLAKTTVKNPKTKGNKLPSKDNKQWSKWKLQTQVATNKPVLQGGVMDDMFDL
jgi:hypothetical protein